MKLIFLDIDGVLVTRRPGVFEDSLLRNLQALAQSTGADIVLSTDWRRHPSARDEARRVMNSLGLKVLGCTPRLSPFVPQRPTEIMQWKRDFVLKSQEPLTHWIAIDDRALLQERHGQYLRGHFLQTHPLRGLTQEAVQEGIRLLTSETPAPSAKDELAAGGLDLEQRSVVNGSPKRSASTGGSSRRRGPELERGRTSTAGTGHSRLSAQDGRAAAASGWGPLKTGAAGGSGAQHGAKPPLPSLPRGTTTQVPERAASLGAPAGGDRANPRSRP
jgi:hypothetical protein